MKRIVNFIIGLPILLLVFVLIMAITCPPLLEPFISALKMCWIAFKGLFLADAVRKVGIIAFVSIVFGGISMKKQNAIVGIIGAILDLIVLYA